MDKFILLSNRTQPGGRVAGTVNVTFSVAQDSVLGSILFLINDLPKSLASKVTLALRKGCNCIVYKEINFVDDCKIGLLQNDLAELTSWEDVWLLHLNPSKCEVLAVFFYLFCEPTRGLFFIICSASAVHVQSVSLYVSLTQQFHIGRGTT